MKVKITKTVSLSALAGETRRMIDSAKNAVLYGLADQMSQIARHSLSTDGAEYFHTIELIDEFRKELSFLDNNLQEISNVLIGHRNALTPDQDEEAQSDTEEESFREQAEYEKFMSRASDIEEEFDEEG